MDLESLKQFATTRQRQIINAVITYGSQSKAAKALDVNQRTLERSLQTVKRAAAKRGWSPDHDMTHSVPDTHVAKGISTLYADDGSVKQQWVKSDLKKESQEAELQAFADGLIQELPKYKPSPKKPMTELPEYLTAFAIGDAHIGMKVTKERNGDSDWNLEIAERVTVGAIEKLIHASGGSDTALMIDLGDFGHSDGLHNTSSAGTAMDVDGDYGNSVCAQVRVYRRSIDLLLASYNKVILMMVRGNHNSSTSRCMNIMLQAFYEGEPRLTVLDNAHKFQHITYGNNLLVTHHGDRMKPQRAFEYTARSLSTEWGQCEHKHLLMGHVHHATSVEIGGMLCETFQALPAGDAWHSDSGYGAKRTMSSIVYCKQFGEIQRHKVGIDQLEEAA